jgi:hypothetical protein
VTLVIVPEEQLLKRVRAEYMEMPGLRLTLAQAQRLCGVERALCQAVLDALVGEKFLCVKSDGQYGRLTTVHFRILRRRTSEQPHASPKHREQNGRRPSRGGCRRLWMATSLTLVMCCGACCTRPVPVERWPNDSTEFVPA